MRYEDYHERMRMEAEAYQDFVQREFSQGGIEIACYKSRYFQFTEGENRQGVEIKYDKIRHRSRRLWIEGAEKAAPRKGSYPESGIRKTTATLWVQGDYEVAFVFYVATLREAWKSGRYDRRENSYGTSIGILLPEREAEFMAAQVVRFKVSQAEIKAMLTSLAEDIRRRFGGGDWTQRRFA
jgi:hypothetical protein